MIPQNKNVCQLVLHFLYQTLQQRTLSYIVITQRAIKLGCKLSVVQNGYYTIITACILRDFYYFKGINEQLYTILFYFLSIVQKNGGSLSGCKKYTKSEDIQNFISLLNKECKCNTLNQFNRTHYFVSFICLLVYKFNFKIFTSFENLHNDFNNSNRNRFTVVGCEHFEMKPRFQS